VPTTEISHFFENIYILMYTDALYTRCIRVCVCVCVYLTFIRNIVYIVNIEYSNIQDWYPFYERERSSRDRKSALQSVVDCRSYTGPYSQASDPAESEKKIRHRWISFLHTYTNIIYIIIMHMFTRMLYT